MFRLAVVLFGVILRRCHRLNVIRGGAGRVGASTSMFRLRFGRQADPNASDDRGRSALLIAALRRHVEA
jgi:hypothetical protein